MNRLIMTRYMDYECRQRDLDTSELASGFQNILVVISALGDSYTR